MASKEQKALCPYISCQGEVVEMGLAGYCGDCQQPVFFCSSCESPNRSYAQRCRRCGNPISFLNGLAEQSESSASWNFHRDPHQFSLPGEFWAAPLAQNGFLWCLSTRGLLYKVSPYGARTIASIQIGAGYGKSPGVICEVGPQKAPHFLAASSEGVKAVNLVTEDIVILLQLDGSEEIQADLQESYVTVAVEGERFFFLSKRVSTLFLTEATFEQGKQGSYEIPAELCAGPVCVGPRIAAYSRSTLYTLEDGEFTTTPFLDGFVAWNKLDDHHTDPMFPSGHLPYVVAPDALYIPGYLNDFPTLLYVTMHEIPEFFPLELDKGVYVAHQPGRLLVSTSGDIRVYGGNIPDVLKSDAQFYGEQCAFVDGPLIADSAESYSMPSICSSDGVIGLPQLGQLGALLEIRLPQSGHGMSVADGFGGDREPKKPNCKPHWMHRNG